MKSPCPGRSRSKSTVNDDLSAAHVFLAAVVKPVNAPDVREIGDDEPQQVLSPQRMGVGERLFLCRVRLPLFIVLQSDARRQEQRPAARGQGGNAHQEHDERGPARHELPPALKYTSGGKGSDLGRIDGSGATLRAAVGAGAQVIAA